MNPLVSMDELRKFTKVGVLKQESIETIAIYWNKGQLLKQQDIET